MKTYICNLHSKTNSRYIGNKAQNLRFLIKHHYAVPAGFVCTWDARADYLSGKQDTLTLVRSQLSSMIRNDRDYAVRSSSSAEDQSQYSYAGLFKSVLHVHGIEAVMEALMEVWQSANSPEVQSYCRDKGLEVNQIQMAVIIQEMVPALYSGVAFSKNPVTGLSEIIIEAGVGAGSQLNNEENAPHRWISKWGNWLEKPDSTDIPEEMIIQVVEKTSDIAKQYGEAVDLEWAYDGSQLHFLQVRRITCLDIPVYSNRISKEMLPGIIKPLVWSVNTRLINEIWVSILSRLTGEDTITPESLTGHFYYRAYFNMVPFGKVFERLGMPYEAIELLLGLEAEGPRKPHFRPGLRTIFLMPRMLAFGAGLLFIEARLAWLLKRKKRIYLEIAAEMSGKLSPKELLDMSEKLFQETKSVVHFNIMIPMFAMMYNKMLENMLEKIHIDSRMLDTSGIRSATGKYNPIHSLQILHQKYFADSPVLSEQDQQSFNKDVQSFLSEFGHFSDSGNDFSAKPWRETPELIAKMAANPILSRSETVQTLQFKDFQIPFFRRGLTGLIYHRACRFAVHREAISSLYTYGYGQFRSCFIGLADHLVELGLLEEREDIFYLYMNEVLDLIREKPQKAHRDLIEQRKAEISGYTDILLPDTIYGTDQPPIKKLKQDVLRGIPTSLGSYTGPVKVLHGIAEFDLLSDGDVLVIPYSDVGWTPLFGKAGAVISESGGVLSHSSIVAREYHIPAVVSVADACRIPDRTIVHVNGFSGEIALQKDQSNADLERSL
ncbi:MAG: PEP/pyruvate-binding domain-containing protein [Eubacteriales bacterium]